MLHLRATLAFGFLSFERRLSVGLKIENVKTGMAEASMLRMVILRVLVPPEIGRFSRALTTLAGEDRTDYRDRGLRGYGVWRDMR
ncbi:MAG TPA: hypothetical protein VN375_01660 [Vicinamibacteria bacterium]|jgi:hypothetical protein|nr:hypothetical protein [Vicinamibacteria bacterium]